MTRCNARASMAKAEYEVMAGRKDVNALMRYLDLGIEGGYLPYRIIVTFKEGESVTKDRATALCSVIREGLEDQSNDIASVKLLTICEHFE